MEESDNCGSQPSVTEKVERSLEVAKNELLNELLLLEKEFYWNEDGTIAKKEEDLNQIFDPDIETKPNQQFLEQLGKIFELLNEVTELSMSSTSEEKINAICFLGNTGSGKSTIIQLLAGDNSKIYSKEVSKDHFIIVDESKIGTNTVTSETLYPELLIDLETQHILCDNPGFEDTRSSLHEIIAMSVMKKILQRMNKLKIVLVCPQASLIRGGNRNDFPHLLKHLTRFINDVKKFKESIHLIGTKVENSFVKKCGQMEMVSDDSIVDGITMFLNEVKTTFQEEKKQDKLLAEKDFWQNSLEIIDSLLETTDNTKYERINIFRRPIEAGPLLNNHELQRERNKIREMLLTDKNFNEIDEGDFCTTLTDTALRFLGTVFEIIDTYLKDLSQVISVAITKYLENEITEKSNFYEVIDTSIKFKEMITAFCTAIEECHNPIEYSNLIKSFSEENSFFLRELSSFENVCSLYIYLTSLENKENPYKFFPLSWSASIKPVLSFLDTKLEEYYFLKEVFLSLSAYKTQRIRKAFPFINKFNWKESEISKNDFMEFLQYTGLQRYSFNNINNILNELKTIVNLTMGHQPHFYEIEKNVLIIVDYFVILSELGETLYKTYPSVNKIIIIAMHTIFIDFNMTNNWFKEKEIIIFAPIWEVNGSRTINVDGTDPEVLPKADIGNIGKDGANGKPGGIFLGVGMVFRDSHNLKISASGGAGQNGQDGGDGKNGADGQDGIIVNEGKVTHSSGITTGLYNQHDETLEYKGYPGVPGGDSGEGGKGGQGGKKGSVAIHNTGEQGHEITIVAKDGKSGIDGKDGKPGTGGNHGKTVRENKTDQSIFFLLSLSATKTNEKESNEKAPDGKIKRKARLNVEESVQTSSNAPAAETTENGREINDPSHALIVNNFQLFQNNYLEKYSSFLTDGMTEKFMKCTQKYIIKSLGVVEADPK